MDHDINKYLFDILTSINAIELHLSDIENIAKYKNSLKTRDAVERRLSIIGEALNKANKINDQLNISNKSKIIGLRHILIHDYNLIEDETIWVICKKYLPLLKKEIVIIQ